MYKSKRSLKVYEAPLDLNSKQQIPRIQLQDQWLEALGYHVGDKIDVQCTGINVNLKMYSFDHLRMYNIDHINTCCSRW